MLVRWIVAVAALAAAMGGDVRADARGSEEGGMSEERTFTVAEAHQWFAIELNNTTWELIDNEERTPEEAELMVHQAHASVYHWMQVGTPINHARGEYLVSRAHAAAGHPAAALRHALRCNELVAANPDEAADWDVAFAYEVVARGYALTGSETEAREWLAKAEDATRVIDDEEDKKICEDQLNTGPWNGVR